MNRSTPSTIFKDKKLITTSDGSFTLYSSTYNESYKTKSVGAFTESYHKFVMQSDIVARLQKNDVRLLDICFGLGQNIAASIYEIEKHDVKNKLHIVSVELDPHLIEIVKSFSLLRPVDAYKIVRTLLNGNNFKNYSLELYVLDAVKFIYTVTGKFDIVYFDPFSKKHNSELWSLELFKRLYEILNDNGILLTYASSRAIRDDFVSAGFGLESVISIGSRNHPSLKAKKLLDKTTFVGL